MTPGTRPDTRLAWAAVLLTVGAGVTPSATVGIAFHFRNHMPTAAHQPAMHDPVLVPISHRTLPPPRTRLKRMYAELALGNVAMKDLIAKEL